MKLLYFSSEEVIMANGVNIPWVKGPPNRLRHIVEAFSVNNGWLGTDMINYNRSKWEISVYL